MDRYRKPALARDGKGPKGSSTRRFDTKLKLIVSAYPKSLQLTIKEDLKLLSGSGLDSFDSLLREVQSADANKRTRAVSCWVLGQLRDKHAVRPLLVAFEDSNRDVRWEAGKALAFIGSKLAVRPLIGALQHGNMDQRAAAAYALGALRDRHAVEPLIAALQNKHEHPRVRAFAAEALAYLADRRAVTALISVLADSSAEVRFWSAFALGELGARRAIQRIVNADTSVIRNWGPVSAEAARAIEVIQTNAE